MNETYTLSMSTAVADLDMQSQSFPVYLYFIMGSVLMAAVAILFDLLANLAALVKSYFPYKILNELLGII